MPPQDDDAENAMGSSSGSSPGDVFDVRKVRKLVELMDEHDLAEIVLQQGDQKMKLRRGGDPVTFSTAPPAPPQAPAAPPPPPAAPAAPDAGEATAGDVITSPMVGTFYAATSPDAAPFIKVGDQVGPDTTVCIIEAMKVFNEIPAECSGKILAVLVENGAPVEFGQPLFKVQKS